MPKELLRGFKEAKKITKKFAKTFYLASLFLPKEKRLASYAIYAICRLSDEAVDDLTCNNHADKLQKLELKITDAYSKNKINEPLLAAFQKTISNYQIPKEYFDELIKGMYMDLELKRYPDFEPLYQYCYRVAGVVGLIMLKIFGYRNKTAENYAIKLGVAMQLTNILRDIKEDFNRNRIYLPQNEMLEYNVSENQISQGLNDDKSKNLLRFQIGRCRKFYNDSSSGIPLIENRLSRFVILVMQENYCAILDEIQNNNYDITKRAFVPGFKKIIIIFKILLERKYL